MKNGCVIGVVSEIRQITPSLFLSPILSVFPVVFSLFLPLFLYCSIAPPPIIHSFVSFSHCILSAWNKLGFGVANASNPFSLLTHPHYPKCFAVVGDVHLTISNELTCVFVTVVVVVVYGEVICGCHRNCLCYMCPSLLCA